MDNPELILQSLEHFPKLKDQADYSIPIELDEYIHYVAKTGDPVFQWTLVQPLFREKIIKVVTEFFESNPGEIPDYPNVNKFNYDSMKTTLLERIDWFKGAPFTIQRISELLVNPTKEYNRVDKYMRALEKNIYVVSTREPGMPQPVEENNSTFEESFILNGNDFELKSSENNEILGAKEEDADATALLLLKKCSNGDSDEVNFNIEVDVTNTTPGDDAPSDGNLESAEINVHDEVPESDEAVDVTEGKCGQTRKLEDEDEHVENDPKRFKMDEGEIKEDSKVVTEEVMPKDEDMNIEQPAQTLEINNEPDSSKEQTLEKKSVEMELEETVDNKIELFDNSEDKNNTSLNISEGDLMVISQESVSGSEKSIEENMDTVVSESSDMDLSDGVNTVDFKNIEIAALLELPEAEESSGEKLSDNVSDNATVEEKEEKTTSASNDTNTANLSESTPAEDIVSSETEKSEQSEDNITQENIVTEADSKEESSKLEASNNEPATFITFENQAPLQTTEEENVSFNEVQPIEQTLTDDSTPRDNVDITTEEFEVESTSEVNTEIEEAILQEDEFENPEPEEAGSNVDPLSTEADAEQLIEEVDTASAEGNPSDASEELAVETEEVKSSTSEEK